MGLGLRQGLVAAGLFGTLVLTAGCASTGQLDLLESRLRHQEDATNQLQAQLTESQNQLQASRREAVDLRTQLADGKRTAHAEQVSALGQVEGISLNKYLTGGFDKDGVPGDEIFSAVVMPADADGNLVKAPGSVVLTVLDLSKPEAQQRVGHWEFGPKESEDLWHSGFFGSGYVVRVPWQTLPESPTLLVHARLKTVDGRQFDTSQSIRINPPTATAQAATQPAAPQPGVTQAGGASSELTPPPAAGPQPSSAPPASLDTAMTKTPSASAPASDAWWEQASPGNPKHE
jgi:outer membrane murein-binding lipoprotein Lpp